MTREGKAAMRDGLHAARLRGLFVHVEVDIDVQELERRERGGLSVAGLGHARLGALLTIPRWEFARLSSIPDAGRRLARARPDLIDQRAGGFLRRRVGPPLWVEMVTLPVERWRCGLKAIGRFAPYSARQLQLAHAPEDLNDLCVQATYWGIGVQIAEDGLVRDVVVPEPFVPQRYTGASWAFAEQTLRAMGSHH